MRNDRSHIWYSSHPEPSSIGSETVTTPLYWDSFLREGSNIESHEMFVETVDSHILLSPAQVFNQTCTGRGERGRIQGAALWWGIQYSGSPFGVNVFNAINRFESNKDSISVSPRITHPQYNHLLDFRYCFS